MAKTGSIPNPVVLILAAGLARRMEGRDKPGLRWVDGRTLLEHQEQVVRQAGLESLAVTRQERTIQPSVANPHPERGMGESLRCGLRAARKQFGPVPLGVLLADQPFVTASDISAVLAAFQQRRQTVHAMRARYNGIPGHPVFFDPAWDVLVDRLSGDVGLGSMWRSRGDAGWVDIDVGDRPDPSFDIDTEDAYQKALAWLR